MTRISLWSTNLRLSALWPNSPPVGLPVLVEVSLLLRCTLLHMFWGGVAFGQGDVKKPPHGAPSKGTSGSSSLAKAVFIGQHEKDTLCLGYIGKTKTRFCIARKIKGALNCGVSSHAVNKMNVAVDTFWVPGGDLVDKPTAKADIPPIGLHDNLSLNSLEILRNGLYPLVRWPEHFKQIVARSAEIAGQRKARSVDSPVRRVSNDDREDMSVQLERQYSEDEVDGELHVDTYDYEIEEESNIDLGTKVDVPELNFALGWEATCRMLHSTIQDMAKTISCQSVTIDTLRTKLEREKVVKDDIDSIRIENLELQGQLGDLMNLVGQHGSLSNAMSQVMSRQTHSEVEIATVLADVADLNTALQDFASHNSSPIDYEVD